jgi:hypothetical protein
MWMQNRVLGTGQKNDRAQDPDGLGADEEDREPLRPEHKARVDRRHIRIEGNKTRQSERLGGEAKNRLTRNQSPVGKSSAE